MIDIRPAGATDAPRLQVLLTQLGYPSELGAVTRRLADLLDSATHEVLVAAPAGDSRIGGCICVERRLVLERDDSVEITGLVVDSAARRSGLGRALVDAAERWASRHAVHTVVVRSNVERPESHPFYERIGYRRTTTSHTYRKEVAP
jgi:GNAT superfamily N-acetyltransferase